MSLNPNPLPLHNDARPHFSRARCNAIFHPVQRTRETEHMVRAAELRYDVRDKNLPFHPAGFGFVFSNSDIPRHARPRDPRKLAA